MQGSSSGSCKLGSCAHCCLSQLIVSALNSCILYSVSVFSTQCFVSCITFSGYYLILLCNTIKRERRKSSGFEKTNIQPSSTPLRDLNHITLYLVASMLCLGSRFAWRCCVMSSGDIRSVRNACKVFLAASWSAAEMSLVCFIGSFLKLPGLWSTRTQVWCVLFCHLLWSSTFCFLCFPTYHQHRILSSLAWCCLQISSQILEHVGNPLLEN